MIVEDQMVVELIGYYGLPVDANVFPPLTTSPSLIYHHKQLLKT